MKRREFLGVLSGAAAAWPLDVRGQQTLPLVGFLNGASPDTYRFNADSFRDGLAKAGFVEGKNVRIEERWARGDYQALPALAAELVAKGVVAIAATGPGFIPLPWSILAKDDVVPHVAARETASAAPGNFVG
jgi:putative ABC transport system substrate-binding protein